MKWILLVVIVLIVVLALGLWRRTVNVPGPPDRTPVHEQPPPVQAAEAGVDEVVAAPATETRPAGHLDDSAVDPSEDWWPDSGAVPPERS